MSKIPINIKKQCVLLKESGKNSKYIYENYFIKELPDNDQNYNSFRTSLLRWSKKDFPDDITLNCGTYENFICHDATVQVNHQGDIVQAWIKQSANDINPEKFMEAIKGSIEPYTFVKNNKPADSLLEIPLFDMHWGIAFFEHYEETLQELLNIVTYKHWDVIEIPIGQDCFHNDSLVNGETTKGTKIQKVDMEKAVKDAKRFYITLIDACIQHSNKTAVTYSPGNHDRSIAWMFVQILKERYGSTIVNDTIQNRYVFTYGNNAIMLTHGQSKKARKASELVLIFSGKYPKEFALCKNKEIHAGHLHEETDTDVHGIMVRRMPTKNITDEWSDIEDFINSIKRFRLFVYTKDKPSSIIYI